MQAASFWTEIGLGVLLPAVLLAIPSLRRNPKVLFWSAMLVVVFGVALNRLNVSVIGLWSQVGYIYFPSWMEIIVTVTIVAIGVLAFGFAARYLPVFPDEREHGAA